MRKIVLALAIVILASTNADAGPFKKHRQKKEQEIKAKVHQTVVNTMQQQQAQMAAQKMAAAAAATKAEQTKAGQVPVIK